MKKNEVQIGATYHAKVSDKLVEVRIDAENRHSGWDATNLATGKKVRIKSAQRLRGAAAPAQGRCQTRRCRGTPVMEYLGKQICQACWDKISAEASHASSEAPAPKRKRAKADADAPKKLSALDAAAQVLQSAGAPMRCKALIEAMTIQGLWTSPGGKTPEATLYSAILREIGTKGADSRFTKVERGHFKHAG